jgi:hypothetical protein
MLKNIITSSVVFAISFSFAYADVTPTECSTDSVFSQYSCTQCFDGGAKGQ